MNEHQLRAVKQSGIMFKHNKNGKKTAWYFSFRSGRKFRLPLAEAELLVNTKQVKQVNELL